MICENGIEILLNIEKAFIDSEKCGRVFGGWALSKCELAIFVLHLFMGCAAPNIVELGAGQSTLFWAFLSRLKSNYLKLFSYEHHPSWSAQVKKAVSCCSDIVVNACGLRQVNPHEWNMLFKFPVKSKYIYPNMGLRVPLSEFENTRICNAFYDISVKDIPPPNSIDGMVVDGAHGNGRSLAFPLFYEALKQNALILIDDIDHYPFESDLKKIFDCKLLKREFPETGKHWSLYRVNRRVSK